MITTSDEIDTHGIVVRVYTLSKRMEISSLKLLENIHSSNGVSVPSSSSYITMKFLYWQSRFLLQKRLYGFSGLKTGLQNTCVEFYAYK